MRPNNKGFTVIELVVVIVCIGILAAISLPKFINIASSAEKAAEEEIVGNVRTGIQLYFAQELVNNSQGSYPKTLDEAAAGESSPSNPFFTNALQDPFQGRGWSKDNSANYTGPAGTVYSYNSSTGAFDQVD